MNPFSLVANPSETLWRQAVDGFEHTVFTDDFSWKQVVEATYGHQPFYYVIVKDSQPVGFFAAFLVHSPFFGKYLVTAPYGNNGGCYLPETEGAKELILETCRRIVIDYGLEFAELRNINPMQEDSLKPGPPYFNFIMELEADPQAVMDKLRGATRRDIVKAQKSDFSIRVGKEHLPLLLEVLHKNMQRLGSPFHGLRYFDNILKFLESQVDIIVLLKRDLPVSGALLIAHKNMICNLYAATLREYNCYALNSLLYWEIIRYGCELGLKYFEMGRSHLNQGTYDFKRRWGSKIIPLHYEYLLGKKKEIPYLNPANKKFRLAIAIWKKLPIPLTAFLGSRIIGGIA